jgi:hypothetical protein
MQRSFYNESHPRTPQHSGSGYNAMQISQNNRITHVSSCTSNAASMNAPERALSVQIKSRANSQFLAAAQRKHKQRTSPAEVRHSFLKTMTEAMNCRTPKKQQIDKSGGYF